jgi:regulatory protein
VTEDARAYALRLLGQRSYTTRDLARKLKTREFPPEEIERTIERLTETGLLNDERFALSYSRTKLSGSGASRRRIAQALARKGIPRELSERAVDQVIEDEGIDTAANLEKIAKKKLASYGDLEPHEIRRRLYGFLARRGYDIDEIRRVVAGVWSEEERDSRAR